MPADKKKSLGIIGGMGSHASAWLLQRIIVLSKAQTDQDNLEIVLHNNSNIPDRTRAIVFNEASPLEELKRSVSFLNMLNIDVALLACMTAHYYHAEISKLFKGRMLDASEVVLSELLQNEQYVTKKKIGLIGSTGMIRARIFHDKLEPCGYEVIVLKDEEQQKYFMGPLYSEKGIKAGVVNPEIKSLFARQIDILVSRGAEIILGACSEVPLIAGECLEVPFVDTFELLAHKTVRYCYNLQTV